MPCLKGDRDSNFTNLKKKERKRKKQDDFLW